MWDHHCLGVAKSVIIGGEECYYRSECENLNHNLPESLKVMEYTFLSHFYSLFESV